MKEHTLHPFSVGVGPNMITADGVFGVSVFGAPLNPLSPAVLLSYFGSQLDFVANGTNYAAFNASAAAAFIGKVFLSLTEVNAAGTVVQTILLKDLIWANVASATSVGTGGLRYSTYQGTQLLNPTFSISISEVFSDVIGMLNVVGSAVVTPKSVETIITINNFPYISTANSVSLNMAVATEAGFVVATGKVTTLTAGTGNGAAYFTLDHVAKVNGVVAGVVLSGFAAGTADTNFANSYITGSVTAKYGAVATLQFISVKFPAGASSIVYDPSMGAGSMPPTVASAGMTVTASFFLSMLAFALLCF